MLQHHRFKVSSQSCVSNQRRIKAPPDQRLGRAIVFQQFIVDGQAKALQGRHGRTAQQGRKPAVEGADLHWAAGLQYPLI